MNCKAKAWHRDGCFWEHRSRQVVSWELNDFLEPQEENTDAVTFMLIAIGDSRPCVAFSIGGAASFLLRGLAENSRVYPRRTFRRRVQAILARRTRLH